MRASQNIIDFIKTFEALRLEAYDDGGGVCVMKNGKATAGKQLRIGVSLRGLGISSIAEAEAKLIEDSEYGFEVAKRIARNCRVSKSGCIEWGGAATHNGYGKVTVSRKAGLRAHRAAYILAHNTTPKDGEYVCHSCDNPKCVNPDHLFVGTPKDNTSDMLAKGRGANPPVHSGEAHPNATLSTEQLEQVKARYAQLRNYSAVGREFGVSHQTVRRIQNNLTRVNG